MGQRKRGALEPCRFGHAEGRNSQNRCLVCCRLSAKRRRADPAIRERERLRSLAWARAHRGYSKEWWAKNKDKAQRYQDRKKSKFHGLTRTEVLARLAAQGGKCAVCGTTEPGGSRGGWPADHDHATGAVRGILCHGCNVGIGNLRDDPARCRAAAEYLERHAALRALL